MGKKNIFKSCLLVLITILFIRCGSIVLPEIVFDRISDPKELHGQVDFIGIQWFHSHKSYNAVLENIFKWREKPLLFTSHGPNFNDYITDFDNYIKWPNNDMNCLSLFIENMDEALQQKLHIFSFNKSFFYTFFISGIPYRQVLNDVQMSIRDRPNTYTFYCTGLPFKLYKENEQGKMESSELSRLKKYSKADYFLLIAMRPLEILLPDDKHQYHEMTTALLTVIYNRNGEKVYSKIYEDSLDAPDGGEHTGIFYKSALKLLENQGAQISKDLSFLLSADDAPSPNLADLYNELQKTDSLKDVEKSLKEMYKGK
jgi:hypothetical protein